MTGRRNHYLAGKLKKNAWLFHSTAGVLSKFFPYLEQELEASEMDFKAKEYLSVTLSAFFTVLLLVALALVALAVQADVLDRANSAAFIALFSVFFASIVFFYALMIPRWLASKKTAELEANLLYAARQLMIQTTAGVPLFDSIVNVSEEFEDERLNYGQISREFQKIVKEVRGGKDLSQALEESAARNPSQYYRKLAWQLSNANKVGANIGLTLKNIIEFLAAEQQITAKNYGSQLNPAALFYMIACIIAPTMSLVFLAISSTLVNLAVNEVTLIVILGAMVLLQVTFIGFIKSRRPTVVA